MNAAVSVIIPCYRSSNTITRAVDSVAKQTLKPAELIIVDDGSEDDTLEILNKLQDEYGKDWLKIVALKSNNGPSVARNTGWNIASEEYIAFLDADDAWHPEKIAVQYCWMKENPEFVLTAHPCIIAKSYDVLSNHKIPESIGVNLISKYKILFSNKFFTPCVMLKANIHHRFCNSKKYSEDYLLWSQIILSGGKAAYFNYPMTILFKQYFGEAGLSSNLWKMESSELDNLNKLCQIGYISFLEKCFFLSWSFLKYLRRVFIKRIRNNQFNY